MRTTFFNTCGVSIAAFVLGLSLVATPDTLAKTGRSRKDIGIDAFDLQPLRR